MRQWRLGLSNSVCGYEIQYRSAEGKRWVGIRDVQGFTYKEAENLMLEYIAYVIIRRRGEVR